MTEKKKRKRKGERKDGLIQVSITIGKNENGTPKRKVFYGHSRAEVETKISNYKQDQLIGYVKNNITLCEWVNKCLKLFRTNVNKSYIKNDSIPYNHLKEAFENRLITSITHTELQSYLNGFKGMSKSTINSHYAAIKKVFGKARATNIISFNPALELDKPNGTKHTHRALENWEIDCIINNWSKHRCGIWAMIMMLSGLRRGELMALKWENIDFKTCKINVCEVAVINGNQTKIEKRAKTKSGIRLVPICGILRNALLSIRPENEKGFVCVSANGKGQISESTFKRGWNGFNLAMQRIMNEEDIVQAGRRVTLEQRINKAHDQGKEYIIFNVRTHDLRYTFATMLFEANVPQKSAQEYLGHSDIRMTEGLYTQFRKEQDRKDSVKLISYLDDLFMHNSSSIKMVSDTQ